MFRRCLIALLGLLQVACFVNRQGTRPDSGPDGAIVLVDAGDIDAGDFDAGDFDAGADSGTDGGGPGDDAGFDGGGVLTITQVAAGGNSSCALRSDGAVFCWGENSAGQLGDGSATDRPDPVRVALPAGSVAIQVALGRLHGCALLDDNELYCWGENGVGQLGLGDTTDSPTPARVGAAIASVWLGDEHSCHIPVGGGGAAHCWGRWDNGRLGLPVSADVLRPTAVPGTTGATVLALGVAHTCVSRGTTSPTLCWGLNAAGQVGDETTDSRPSPVPVLLSGASWGPTSWVGAGHHHSCGVVASAVHCWGNGGNGRLGNADTNDSNFPVATSVTDGREVHGGLDFSCALRSAGSVSCWGRNNRGQLGSAAGAESSVPVLVFAGPATDLELGAEHACAVEDGEAWCWGRNNARQRGLAAGDTDPPTMVPIPLTP